MFLHFIKIKYNSTSIKIYDIIIIRISTKEVIMQTKNILSIDLDIIMHPSIDLYNEEIFADEDPDELWKDLEETYHYQEHSTLSYDEKTVLELAKLIHKNKSKPFHFITSHEEIVTILKNSPTYNQENYNLVNIDFHHDLWYTEEDFPYIVKEDGYDCTNWLGYLYLKKKIAQMTWMKAPNSSKPNLKIYGGKFQLNTLTLREFFRLEEQDFDEVFVCLSPQWIPPQHRFFYEIFKLIVSKE
jgi:hypothetical protein